MVHPGRNPDSPEEIIRTYAEAGGNLSRLVMAHLESKHFFFSNKESISLQSNLVARQQNYPFVMAYFADFHKNFYSKK